MKKEMKLFLGFKAQTNTKRDLKYIQGAIRGSLISYQLCVVLNRLLYPLRLDADIALCGGGGAVLQQPLDKGDIVAVILVNLRGIPLAEAVGADVRVAQIITDNVELLPNGALGDREDIIGVADGIAQAVVLNILLNHQRHREDPVLSGLLFYHFQAVAVAIPNNIARPQPENVADAQAQVCFQNQGRSNPFIGAAAAKALLHIVDDFLVLLLCQSLGFLVHSYLQ